MFISRISADAGADRSPAGSFWFQPVGMRTASGARVTPASAMTLPAVLSCVRVLAESFAIMPFGLFAPKAKGGHTRVTKHWLYRLIVKAPNRFQTPYEWRLMLMGHLALRGNAFCQILANGRGEITELLPLHPDRMSIEPLDNGSYRYVYVDQNGRNITFARNEIWHLRGLSDDGMMGMSLIGLAREAIGEGIAIQSYSTRFFANDAKPGGGWIEHGGTFANGDAKKKFRDSWQDMQGGANRGKVAVLERGMKFHELGMSNKDSQFSEARADKRKDIASIFRVPPHKIMDLERSTNNNIEHQGIEFWIDTMLPWATLWQSSISYFLLGEDVDLEPNFDHKPMMRGDAVSRAERISKLVSAGVMTRNEGREEEDLDPIEGLDEPLRPLNMVNESQAEMIVPAPSAPAPQQQDSGASARLARLVQGNAARMVRRLMADKPVPAETLAEALDIAVPRASAWLELSRADLTEDELIASLVALGEKA